MSCGRGHPLRKWRWATLGVGLKSKHRCFLEGAPHDLITRSRTTRHRSKSGTRVPYIRVCCSKSRWRMRHLVHHPKSVFMFLFRSSLDCMSTRGLWAGLSLGEWVTWPLFDPTVDESHPQAKKPKSLEQDKREGTHYFRPLVKDSSHLLVAPPICSSRPRNNIGLLSQTFYWPRQAPRMVYTKGASTRIALSTSVHPNLRDAVSVFLKTHV